jgi:serine/threonine protein kinase
MSSPPHERTLEPGTVVAGKLRVVRTLGVGGMGAVYEVEHSLTKHRRALKILHRRISQSATVVARFHREASAAARIGNPHISETFDAGTLDSGEAYLLMELLEGETLDARLQRLGPLDPGELAELLHQACDGVQAAHEAGIVHRDLKPENLFVTTREAKPFLKVLDFGISKFETESGSTLGVTAEGAVMGTPFYMPPEQVRGLSSIDLRADVYSLGVILYECATGVRPYMAPTIEQLAVLIHEGKATPLAERRPSLPRAFCEVVERAMTVDRDQRYQTARELALALAPLRASYSSQPPGPRNSEPPRVVIRPSQVPIAMSGTIPATAPPSAALAAETALAATLGVQGASPPPSTATASPVSDTMPPPAPRQRSGTWAILGVAAAVAAALLGVLHPWSSSPPNGSSNTTVASPQVPAPQAPVLPPEEAVSPVPSPVASATLQADSGSHAVVPARTGTGKTTASISVAPGPSQTPPAIAAPAPPPPRPEPPPAPPRVEKTRAEKQGLAPENPYANP